MSLFRQIYRSAKVSLLLFLGSIELMLKRPKTRAERAAWLCTMCRRMLRGAHIQVQVLGQPPTSGAIICNHLTYVDILVHASVQPCVFVSKAELRKTPVIGWMSTMSGTVYVERGAGGSAAKAAEGMAAGFRDGLPVVFFPEGTTGVGDEAVMPLRSGLLAETIAAGEPVTPSFLHYQLDPQDLARGKTLRDDVHWGPQSMLGHLWRFLALRSLEVKLRFADQAVTFSSAAIADRKIAAEEAREALLAVDRLDSRADN